MDKVWVKRKVWLEELRQGGGTAHFRERDVSETKQKCVYPEEDFLNHTTVPNTNPPPLDVLSVKSVKNQKARDVRFLPDAHGPTGWTWSSFSGLRSCGAAAALRPLNTAPSLIASVP